MKGMGSDAFHCPFHLAQTGLERWKAADRIEVAVVGEFVDVGVVPAVGAVHDTRLDAVGDARDELHRAARRADPHRLAVTDAARAGIARVDFHQRIWNRPTHSACR